MGNSIVGVAGTGADATKVSPVIIAGLDSQGKVRPILVTATGAIQVSIT